jgi:hypothetical protein
MAMVSNAKVESFQDPGRPPAAEAPTVTRVFILLVSPYLYGMERAVIERFDSLRPEVELFSSRAIEYFNYNFRSRKMTRRRFSIQFLADQTHWERLAKRCSFEHLYLMVVAAIRSNVAILKRLRGQDVLYVSASVQRQLLCWQRSSAGSLGAG